MALRRESRPVLSRCCMGALWVPYRCHICVVSVPSEWCSTAASVLHQYCVSGVPMRGLRPNCISMMNRAQLECVNRDPTPDSNRDSMAYLFSIALNRNTGVEQCFHCSLVYSDSCFNSDNAMTTYV